MGGVCDSLQSGVVLGGGEAGKRRKVAAWRSAAAMGRCCGRSRGREGQLSSVERGRTSSLVARVDEAATGNDGRWRMRGGGRVSGRPP